MAETDIIDPETAVRQYLSFLANPASLRDDELIATLDAAASDATDPIDKLKLLSQRDRAKAVNGEPFKLAFVLHAKTWAEANDVTASAFKAMKVSQDVLEAAGFVADGARSAAANKPKLTTGRVKAYVLTLSGDFRIAEVQAALGGNTTTIKRALDQMIAADTVTRVGALENYSGMGRAPIVYRR